MPNAAATVAATIRAELARRGHSQKWLADQLGISGASMSANLRGTTPISVNRLITIAGLLEVSTSTLLGDPADAEKAS